MGFNIELLAKVAKAYGAPLYETGADVGTENGTDVSLSEDGTELLVPDGVGGVFYVAIDNKSLETGFDLATCHFVMYAITALRDADGVYNGNAWSVTKGQTKYRMRAVDGKVGA